jgi:poly(3-hydroxybutyrate) depolymerase
MRAPSTILLVLGLMAPAAWAREERLGPGRAHALTTEKHGRGYVLFVPSKYSKRSSWPLVVSSHGRGGSGAGEMRAWRGLANKHGFIVACPDTVTATHDREPTSSLSPSQEDDEVLMSIIEAVSARFRVNRRAVMITGFSGGGNPSYHSGLRHPEVFTHICTRGGNFAPQQIPTDEAVLEAVALAKEDFRRAITALRKAQRIEEKAGLRPRAVERLETVEVRGRALLREAETQHADDPSAAIAAARRIAREFAGLAVAETAKERATAWKTP